MSSRGLFLGIMHYGDFDRMPVWHWKGWPETEARWYEEGLPREVDHHQFFDAEPLPRGIPINTDLYPLFDEVTLEETAEYRVFRQSDGVIAQHFKERSALPHYVDFHFKDRSGWAEYEKRLQPHPDRIPANLDATIQELQALEAPLAITASSMVGLTRNWMGVNHFGVACREDPDLLAEVADTIANLVCWCMDQVLPKVQVDLGWAWEDICFKTGPLVPPEVFRKAAVPAYRRITEKLRHYGCDLCLVDSDGNVDDLVPLWLEAGVNVLFPIEVGTWDGDPMVYRRRYGQEFRVVGGIDKRVLERDKAAIDAEIERRKPLMAEGGFIPLPDHLITPDTPLDNYRYYLDKIRALRF